MRKRSHFKAMRELIKLVKPLTLHMIAAITLGLIGHFSASFITIFGVYGLLHLLGFTNIFTYSLLIGLLLLMAFVRAAARYGEQSFNHYIAFSILAIVRDKVFKALRKLSPAKLEGMDKGNLISIITGDVELLEVFYAHTISPIMIATLFSIVLSLFIGSFHHSLGLLAFVIYAMVGIVLPLITTRLSQDNGTQFRNKAGQLSSFILETMYGLFEVIQYNQQESRHQMLYDKTNHLLASEEKMKRLTGFNMALTNTVIMLCNLLMIIVASILYSSNAISFVGLIISIVALMSSYGPVIALSNLAGTLQNTFASAHRILDILEEEPLVNDIENQEPTSFGLINVAGVSFKYEDLPVLSDVSLEIQPETIFGISGRSGSGKSTLLKLLMRFWQRDKGSITINHKDINNINTSDLREFESYMTQDTFLFNDTIANNIRLGKLDASEQEIINASKKAALHDFVLSLPNGYQTITGELGDSLSGGERQRIGLARAFLHDSDLMLLDEPTSNLDSLNEAIILKSLQQEREQKTIVLVSHRSSTMAITDKVITIENGQVQA